MTLPRIIIVGAGLMGRWHAFSAIRSGATIEAVVDPQLDRAKTLQREFGAKHAFKTLSECLEQSQSNIAHICTPAEHHFQSIDACLDKNLHVLAEKPLLSTFDETKRALAKANERGLKIAPVHQMPFQKGASQIVESRADLGNLVRLSHTAFTSGADGKSKADRLEVLLEILPHPVSIFYRYFGDKLTVDTFEIRRFVDGELEIDGVVDDTLLRISISLRGRPTRNEVTVIGDKTSAHVDLFHGFATIESGEVSKRSKILKPFKFGSTLVVTAGKNLIQRSATNEVAYPGLRQLIRQFYRSALSGKTDPITQHEILLSAELIDKVRASAV
ncbi:MAG TPA: Gfo/Idh/MocA family oxidoreductase [Drouetiella sp.]